MRKILIIGNGPLPEEKGRMHVAAGLRTSQFFKGVTRHFDKAKIDADIGLVKIDLLAKDFDKAELNFLDSQIVTLYKEDPALKKKMQDAYDLFKPDCVVAVNTFSAFIASSININVPLWSDLNGWIMSEAQAQAFKISSNDYISHYWAMERAIVQKSDKLSVVSEAQKFAILGELASFGRLNSETFSYDFISTIQNAREWEGKRLSIERLSSVPEDGFKLLWLGGYNTWVDEFTLFHGVEDAMKQNDSIYYISTGGAIKGLDDQTFKNFKDLVDKSEFKDRFIFLGWIDSENIPALYSSVDAGLNVDRMCTETLTGARNRINEMMMYGLPVISTLGSEISYDMAKYKAGIGVESANSKALTSGILEMKESHSTFTKNAKKYINDFCSYEHTLGELFKWLKKPSHAPDRGVRVNMGKSAFIKAGILYLRKNGVRRFFGKVFGRLF